MSSLRRVGIALAAIAALIVGAGAIAALGGGYSMGSKAAPETTAERSITVLGQGRVSITPDTAQVTLGVQIMNADLAAAQQEASDKMNAVIAALKSNGVADDKIRTVNYAIYIERDYSQPNSPMIGYQVVNLVQAEVSPVDKVAGVIQAAVDAGANQVNGVGFTVKDQNAAVQQARKQAVEDAKAKATELAGLAGVKLGPVVSMIEGSAGGPPMPMAARDVASGGAGAGPIEPGQTEISIAVTVSYAIE
jgi:uncharacterized protein YggE